LQGVIIPSAILKLVFRHILFFWFLKMQFGLWLAAAFVSSPVHLLTYHFNFLIIKTGVLVVIFLVLCCGRGQVS